MDVATHSSGESYKMKVRLQASGRNLNVEISDLERSMFVGGHLPTEDPFENTNYVKVDMATPVKFKVTLDSAGKFQSLTLASGMNVFQKNLAKGWAQNLQVDAGQISQGKKAFKSEEVTNSLAKKFKFLILKILTEKLDGKLPNELHRLRQHAGQIRRSLEGLY